MSRLFLLVAIPLLAAFEYLKIGGAKGFEILIVALISLGFYFMMPVSCEMYTLYLILFVNVLLAVNLFIDPAMIKHQKSKIPWSIIYIALPSVLAIQQGWHTEPYMLLTMMLLIWISDSGAYFVGSQIGKRKLFPRISPNKTWEGFLGAGMLCCIASYFIFSLSGQYNVTYAFLFGLTVWIAGTIGDLIASQVKRLHGVKDSSNILPGHGGFYDRFDSFIYSLSFLLVLGGEG